MNAELSAPRRWMSQLSGVGLYTVLYALPHATSLVLFLRLVNWRSYGNAGHFLIMLAVFIVVSVVCEVISARRGRGWLAPEGSSICFDGTLTFAEKIRRLQASAAVWTFLAAELVAISLLSIALVVFR